MNLAVNEGRVDRTLRGTGAVVALVSIVACPNRVGKVISAALAAFLGVTAVTGSCPCYRLLGVNTLDK